MTGPFKSIPGVGRKGARILARLWRRDDAVAAIEFALLGSTFLLLVCMIFELGLILFTQSVMDNALRDAARQVMTKQITTGSAFQTKVCNEVGNLVTNCTTNLKYYVQTGATFSAMTIQTTISSNGFTDNGGPSANGSAQDMLAQVAYSRSTIIPWASTYLHGSNVILSTLAFQNEPY
jgi:Flp pilus assembly protein TadG